MYKGYFWACKKWIVRSWCVLFNHAPSLLLMQPGFSRGSVRYSRVPARRELIVFLLHAIFIRVCLQHIQGLQQFVHEHGSYPWTNLSTLQGDITKISCIMFDFLGCRKFSEFPGGGTKGRTIRKVMVGGGVGNCQLARIFFFLLTACAGIFFSGERLCTNFFQTNIAFLWTVKSWFIIYVFVLYSTPRENDLMSSFSLVYTHNRSKYTIIIK